MEHTTSWIEWRDFDEDGDTGRTIIGDDRGRAILCTCDATDAELQLAQAAPELLAVLKTLYTIMRDDRSLLGKKGINEALELASTTIGKAEGVSSVQT